MKHSYPELIDHMKELKRFFQNKNPSLSFGKVYQGNPSFSYFSLTDSMLKKQKIKYVLVLNHETLSFKICLSAQNKQLRKSLWTKLHSMDCSPYNLVKDVDSQLHVLEDIIEKQPNLNDKLDLFNYIELEVKSYVSNVSKELEKISK